jgi:hypothetical protein
MTSSFRTTAATATTHTTETSKDDFVEKLVTEANRVVSEKGKLEKSAPPGPNARAAVRELRGLRVGEGETRSGQMMFGKAPWFVVYNADEGEGRMKIFSKNDIETYSGDGSMNG